MKYDRCKGPFLAVAGVVLCLSAGCGGSRERAETPEANIAQGWEYLTISDFDLAAKAFEAAVEDAATDSVEFASGLYGLGATAQFRRPRSNLARAKLYYERVRDEDQTGEWAPWAALALARLPFLQETSGGDQLASSVVTDESTREAYRKVVSDYPSSWAAQEATLHLAQSLFCSKDKEESRQAIQLLEALLKEHPESMYLYGVYGALAAAAYDEERYMDQYEYMVEQVSVLEVRGDPDRYKGGIYYQIAYHADARLGRADLAIPYYEKILTDYPEDSRAYQIRAALGRLRAAPSANSQSGSDEETNRNGEAL